MIQETILNSNTGLKLTDENMANRFSNLSPQSLSAAMSSAFNLYKQKQMKQMVAPRDADIAHNDHFRDISNSESYDAYRDESSVYENDHEITDSPYYSAIESKPVNNIGQMYQNQHLPILKCKYFESPINQSQIQYDCTAPIARNTPENNEVKVIDYRQNKVASFNVDQKELICLPQAFELFLKNLVGGLHTVYTKLKRLDIVPIVCNVEQVRVLRGLGAIQPGVNRCKLIAPNEFDILYEDCTNSGSRPGRPPKRHTQIDTENNDTSSKIHATSNETNTSPLSATVLRNSKSSSAQSNFQQYIAKSGLQVRSTEQANIPNGPSSMSPYSILTSSSCSSSSLAGSIDHEMNNSTQNIISPSSLNSNFMHKFGFLPYAFNKSSIKNPYLNNFEEPSVYDENLNSINNAAAAYALYGRMLQQQQVPNFETPRNNSVLIKSSSDHTDAMENRDPIFPFKKVNSRQDVSLNKKSCNCGLSQCQVNDLPCEKSNRNHHKKSTVKSDSEVNDNKHQFSHEAKRQRCSKNNEDSLETLSRRNLHPLSVEYLTGDRDLQQHDHHQDNDSLDAISAIIVKESNANRRKPKSSKNSVENICCLIDTVKENICEVESSLKNDIENLKLTLQTEKSLRKKSDIKINHLIRLQNNLRYRMKIQRSVLTGRMNKDKRAKLIGTSHKRKRDERSVSS